MSKLCPSLLMLAVLNLPALSQEPDSRPLPPAGEPPLAVPAAATPPVVPPPTFRVLDDGLLQEAWFGRTVAFQPEKDIDFFWIKPGLDLGGLTIRVQKWEPADLLEKGRDEKDLKKAAELTYQFPLILRNTLGPALGARVKLSSTQGDATLVGRLVDVNAGSQNAKFFVWMGAGSSTATWDLKLVDARTNELLLAVHHRCVSGSAMSEVQDKVEKWCRLLGQKLAAVAVR